MISLLSPADRRQLLASRTNTLLVRYAVVSALLVILVIIEMVVVYLFLTNSQNQSKQTIESNAQTLASYEPIKAQATAFRADLATAKDIMSKQVPYTSILKELADNMPDGSAVDIVTLDPTTFGSPGTMTVRVKSSDVALSFKEKFHNSKLFSDVSIASIMAGQGAYPLTATYNVTINEKVREELGR